MPFIHAGDDILRSKSLDRDSYNSGANAISISLSIVVILFLLVFIFSFFLFIVFYFFIFLLFIRSAGVNAPSKHWTSYAFAPFKQAAVLHMH